MPHPFYEKIQGQGSLNFRVSFNTMPGGYHPLHWHDEVELLYCLNGNVDVHVEGQCYALRKKHIIVIDSRLVHSTYTHGSMAMMVCIQLSKQVLSRYIPDLEDYSLSCIIDEQASANLSPEHFRHYLELCQFAEQLMHRYVADNRFFIMEADGLILQMMAHILEYFSTKKTPDAISAGSVQMERIREIISYVDLHYKEPISLTQIAEQQLGLNKEYFCRFFKKNMGISFLEYVNEIRLAHIYHDLIHTDLPIFELLAEHGFTNQKLFNQAFKKIYKKNPSQVRKEAAMTKGTTAIR